MVKMSCTCTSKYSTSKPIAVTVKEVIQENYRTVTIVTDVSVDAKPGQFIMVWHPDKAEKPFSITTSSPLSFTVQEVGEFSQFLVCDLRAGEKIWYRGPFGDGVYKIVKGRKILVAGGCGCVPLYALAQSIKEQDGVGNTLIIAGARDNKELLFVNKFCQLGFEVEVATDDGSQGFHGNSVKLLKQHLDQAACVYSCGPSPMLKALAAICKEKKVPIQVSLEEIMKCGFGVCGSCAREGKLVCKDGPVFDKWLE